MDENELMTVRRAAAGDESAFEALLQKHQNMVYSLAYRLTGNRDDALDVSQEAFIKAWRALPAFRGGSSFGTWIYRITVNTAKDFVSSKARHTDLPLDTEEGLTSISGGEEPEATAVRNENVREVRLAVDSLEPEHREVMILRDIEGYSYSEIAEMLGINEGTVKSRISRAREELRKILSENHGYREQKKKNDVKGREKG